MTAIFNVPTTRLADVISDPMSAKIDDPVNQAFISAEIIESATGENFGPIVDYILRPEFSKNLSVLIVMLLSRKSPHIFMNHLAFVKWAKENKALNL